VRSIAPGAIERNCSRTQGVGPNAGRQPASHVVALAGPTIPSLPAIRRGSYLHSIIECTIECMHQCD
jgi:hypothetical protein